MRGMFYTRYYSAKGSRRRAKGKFRTKNRFFLLKREGKRYFPMSLDLSPFAFSPLPSSNLSTLLLLLPIIQISKPQSDLPKPPSHFENSPSRKLLK